MATRADGPHIPPPYDPADVTAIQALELGTADEFQQKRALKWIIEKAAGASEIQFYGTDRETSFALGRGFVGQQIVKLLRLNASALVKPEEAKNGRNR